MQTFQRRYIDVAQQQASMSDILLKGKTRTGQTPTMVQSYSYVGSFDAATNTTVAFGAQGQISVPIQGDSDFICTYFSGLVYDNATGLQIAAPNVLLQITDNSSQRAIFSQPVFFSLVMGNGGFPYILQEPRLYTANNQIVITLTNNLSAQNVNAEIVFSGVRVYY